MIKIYQSSQHFHQLSVKYSLLPRTIVFDLSFRQPRQTFTYFLACFVFYILENDSPCLEAEGILHKLSSNCLFCNPAFVSFLFTRFSPKKYIFEVNSFISLHVTGWPLGFMFDSNSAKAEVLKVFSLQAQKQGLQPGHILEFMNGKRVGHLNTDQVLDRLTIADWPLRLKFVEVIFV